MTSSVDLFPPRRPLFFPVVIATVFLTIIGMTAGYMLGERHRRDSPARPKAVTATAATSSTVAKPAPTGPPCPREASEVAAKLQLPTELSQVFKIETDKGTTVWICQDTDGRLYYQSKTGGLDGPLVQGQNGLFLTRVTRDSADEYRALAENGNRFEVNRKVLRINFTDGRVQTDTVDRSQ